MPGSPHISFGLYRRFAIDLPVFPFVPRLLVAISFFTIFYLYPTSDSLWEVRESSRLQIPFRALTEQEMQLSLGN